MKLLSTRMCLLAGLACLIAQFPAHAAEAPAAPAAPASPEQAAPTDTAADASETTPLADTTGLDSLEDVIVYGTNGRLVAGLRAESELDEEGISAYGANTVGDLLAKVAPDVDNSEQGPVILINGKPANGIRSVNDLPPEAIARLQVLPPQAAGAIGESPTRRVINVVLKPEFRQGTGNLTARGATAGRGTGGNGNLSVIKLSGNNISNFSLNASWTDPLLEIHRGIVTVPTALPYDLEGNVVSWPTGNAEIDPALSALAGQPVTVAGVPGSATPALADFLPNANIANTSNMGRYRTLVSDQYNYGINGNISRQLPKNTSLSVNLNLDRNEGKSLTGATSSLLRLPASSPFSPFSRDVNLARYLGTPLQQERKQTNANMSVNIATQLGKWRLMTDTSYSMYRGTTDSQRRIDTTDLQAAINAGTLNPFDELPADMLDTMLDTMLSDHARSRGYSAAARMQVSGSVFDMPAGKANANLRLEWQENGQRSTTTGTNNVSSNRKRQDKIAYLSMQLPLLGSPTSAQGFGMGGEVNGVARDVTATGTIYTYGYGLNWRKGNRVNMRLGFNKEKQSPSPSSLTDPIVIIDDYRAYDFIRQETVLVRYITGGNPDLKMEKRDIINVSGQVRPFKAIDFTLNGQYTRTMYRDPMQSLPSPSAEVQAAFPDRFRRDADGRLYEVDARMVNFVRTRNETARWGGNFRYVFGQKAGASGQPNMISSGQVISSRGDIIMISDGGDSLSGSGWRLNANFTHQWQVAYKRLMREGLPEVDLLKGAAGFGTGQSRHRVNSTIGLAYNGTGMQLNSTWNSASFVNAGTATAPSRIEFHPLLRFDLQAFTNLGTRYPANKPLQGVRISLNVDNVLDAKQQVKDQNGLTPLRYQPYLLNSLGRVISLSFRKSFSSQPGAR